MVSGLTIYSYVRQWLSDIL